MKILIVFTSSYPIGSVSTHRTHNLAKGLSLAGAQVEIIITHPTEKQGRILNENSVGSYEGIKYKYLSHSTVRYNSLLLRKLVDCVSHAKVIYNILFNTSKSDAIIVIGPSFDYRNILPFIAKIAGIKSFIEINEFPFVGNDKSFKSRFRRWFFMHFIIPMYDGYIVISENLKKYISLYKSDAAIIKVPVITTIVNENENSEIGTSPFSVPYIFHAGSLLEEKDGILGAIEAFALAIRKLNKPIIYVITGKPDTSPHYDEIVKLIDKYKLQEHIVFTGYLSENDIPRYFKNAALAIVNKYDTLQNRYCFATKLTEYIRYGVPVITTNVGESNNYLIDGYNAFITKSSNIMSLSEKIVFALSNPEMSKKIAENAFKLINNGLNAEYQGKRLYEFIKRILAPIK